MITLFLNELHFSIGSRFAMMQARIAVVLLLRDFTFSLDSKTTVPLQIDKKAITLKPQNGVYLRIEFLDARPFSPY